MEQVRSNPCPYCGRTFKPRGLGTHIREAHGIKIKTVVRTVVHHNSTTVPHNSTIIPDNSTVVQRPSDYVKKRSKVVNTEAFPVFENIFIGGYCVCKICRKNLKLLKKQWNPNRELINVVCNECLKKYKKEDLHEQTELEATAIWWHIPDSNNQQLRIDCFYTENKILLSEYLK